MFEAQIALAFLQFLASPEGKGLEDRAIAAGVWTTETALKTAGAALDLIHRVVSTATNPNSTQNAGPTPQTPSTEK